MNIRNTTFLQACRQEKTDSVPVWLMRQAGRYQAEYREIKKKYSLVDICKHPEIAAQVTLLPTKQFAVDAAILFSDILIPFEGMGIDFEYVGGEGPRINTPIRSPQDVANLLPFDPETHCAFSGEALKILANTLTIPCIGFVGGPFTLASYLIEGGPSKNYVLLKKFMYHQPEAFHQLLAKLAHEMAAYLIFQIKSGAAAVQIFDTWVGILDETDYAHFVFPYMQSMVAKIKKVYPEAPVILMGLNTQHLLPQFMATGANVLGLDWRSNMGETFKTVQQKVALQGNLDPVALFAPWDVLKEKALSILNATKNQNGFIFNLGHGILPETPVDNVKKLVDLVKAF